MKKLLLLLIFGASPLFAQTALTATTLAANIGSSQTNLQVASATGIVSPSSFGGASQTGGAATLLYIDNEALLVTRVNGTLVNVVRGSNGTPSMQHNAGATVWIGFPNAFLTADPGGACNAANTYSPTIVTASSRTIGHYWNCINSTWVPALSTGAITPTATTAAVGTYAKTFTVNGLSTGELISIIGGPAPTSLCPLVGASVTATNTVTLYFSTLTAAACTPASGTYLISVPRFSL